MVLTLPQYTPLFLLPGPLNFGLSKHILHFRQSVVMVQPVQVPQPTAGPTEPVGQVGQLPDQYFSVS